MPKRRSYNAMHQARLNANPKFLRYNDKLPDDQQTDVDLVKIVVPTEADKEQFLLASKWIHDLRGFDSGIHVLNLLAHLYMCPDLIQVEKK